MTLAQALIAENKRTRNPFLDLGNCGLTELPEELFDCVWLENLNWGIEYFDEDEQEFKTSKNKGEQNQLKTLDSKQQLVVSKNLRILCFSYNQITDITPLQKLSTLQALSFSENPAYTQLPPNLQRTIYGNKDIEELK